MENYNRDISERDGCLSEPPIPRDRLLTVEEVARYLQVKPKTVYNWVSLGLIPCIRKGNGLVRFQLNKVDKWLAGFEQKGRKTRRIPVDSTI